jgi:ferredoxin-NADP reductase
MLNRHLADSDFQTAIFYICGPPAMLEAMRNLLQNELQIPRERIRIEEFTGY